MELFSEVTSPKQVEQTLSNGYCVVSTPAATTTLVTLSDGTKVRLNANSTLEYPVSFSDTEVREVHLKGEAHFEVTKNPHRPFVVKAGEMQTQVLGTIFDVKAYRKDAPKVTLMQGKVKVSNADTEVEMRPGQTATLQSDKIVVSRASSSASDWLEGDFDIGALRSNLFEMEWPPRSGRRRSFPEVDRAAWFSLADARAKILPAQRPFLDRLAETLRNDCA